MTVRLNSDSSTRQYQTMGNISCVTVSLIDDDLVEDTEDFTFHLSTSDTSVTLSNPYAAAMITDNDGKANKYDVT